MLTVVKVGGGLDRVGAGALKRSARRSARSASATGCSSCPAARGSPTRCATPTAASGWADATSHRMAILGMEQFGLLLRDLLPGGYADLVDLPAGRVV